MSSSVSRRTRYARDSLSMCSMATPPEYRMGPARRSPPAGPYNVREQVCKPGSVFDSHLSKRAVAGALQPPRERTGRPIAPIPVLLRIEFTASDTLEPMGELLPRLSTLTPKGAVYLCCTFPEVAFGGRYPLSLPCGARTFLMNRLSPCPRDCLAYSHEYCTRPAAESQPIFAEMIELCPGMRYNL